MADVKWIRLSIDMFSNAKIKYLRTLPEGNNIILIWVMLLTIGGRCNSNGFIFLTENIPYTTKILADELGFEESVIILSLNALAKLNMIQQIDDLISITGWDEHQNSLGLEKIREQNRDRQARYKERKSLTNNVSITLPITLGNATELESDKEIDKDIHKKNSSHFVPPTPEEVKAYCTERSNHVDAERFVDFYSSKGWMVGKSKMKDWKACVRTWERDDKPKKPEQPKQNKFNNHDQRDYTPEYYADLEKKLYGKGL